MKTISYKVLFLFTAAVFLTGCYREEATEAVWQYHEPIPPIANGPSNAQKLCYELYQKYGIHIYYNLSGTMAGKSEMGYIQSVSNPAARPFQAADDDSGEVFLTLLKNFYALLPDKFAASTNRRHVLVKINPGLVTTGATSAYLASIMDEGGNYYLSCAYSEWQQGITMYGYLDNNDDTNNTLFSNYEGWKWNVCYQFIYATIYGAFRFNIAVPPAGFILVSTGLYNGEGSGGDVFMTKSGTTRIYDREIGKRCGFVHPFGGVNSSSLYGGSPHADWSSYVAWILTTPYSERIVDIEAWPRIKTKYDLVMEYYKTIHNIDFEAISVRYCALTR